MAFVAFVLGWLRGGHPERFGVMVLLVDHVGATHLFAWVHSFALEAALDVLLLTIFGGLAFRGGRWWPYVVTAALALIVTVHLLAGLTWIGRYDALSARIGLWILVYATVLVGVGERWLAGDRAVSEDLSWRRRVSPAS